MIKIEDVLPALYGQVIGSNQKWDFSGSPSILLPTGTTVRGATLIVAASNSKDKSHADYVCTGTNDDVTIQAAINALPASAPGSTGYIIGGGGTIQLLEGDYYPSANMTIVNNNVRIKGMGQASTLFHVPNSFAANLFTVGGGLSTVIFNVMFEHFGINGNTSNQSGTPHSIFNFTNTVNCYLCHMTVANTFGYVIEYNKVNGQDNYNNWIEDSFFGNCGGFVNEVATETNVYANNYMFGAVGYTGGAYPMFLNGGGATVINNQFGGNSNAANQNAYIRCGNTNPLKIIGNMFNNCSKQWCQLLSGGHSVIGNTFIGGGQLAANTYNAIEIWDGNNIITGNNFAAFTNSNLNDIVEKNNSGNGNIITNNAIHTSLQFGIVILNPYTEVRGNTNFPDMETVVTKTSAYSITSLDYMVVASGTTTITLPTAVGITGTIYVIKNIDATHTVTVATTSSQTIDGATTKALASQYKYIQVMSDGANWQIIANN